LPTVGEGLLHRRPGLPPPLGSLDDHGIGPLDILCRLGPHLGGLAGLLVDKLDPLLLVLLQHRPQLERHGIPGGLVLGAPEFRGLGVFRRGLCFLVGSVSGGLVPFPAAFGLCVVALVSVARRGLFSLVFGGFAEIVHQRHGRGGALSPFRLLDAGGLC